MLERGLKLCETPDGPYMYGDMLESDLKELKKLEQAGDFDGMYEAACRLYVETTVFKER